MWEIAENLFRVDLSKEQRDQHIRRYAELLEAMEKEKLQSAQLAPIESKRSDGKGHRPESGTRAAARELGLDRDDARRAVKVASLSEEAKEAAREVGLDDNRSTLTITGRPFSKRQDIKQNIAFGDLLDNQIKAISSDA